MIHERTNLLSILQKRKKGIFKKVLLNKWNVESESNISSFQAATEVSSICTSKDCCCMDTSMYQLEDTAYLSPILLKEKS